MSPEDTNTNTSELLSPLQIEIAGLCPEKQFCSDRFKSPTLTESSLPRRIATYFELKQAILQDPKNPELQAIANKVVKFEIAEVVRSYYPLSDKLFLHEGDKMDRWNVVANSIFPEAVAAYREILTRPMRKIREIGYIGLNFFDYPVGIPEVIAAQVLRMSKDAVNSLVICAVANSSMLTYGVDTLPSTDVLNDQYLSMIATLIRKRELNTAGITSAVQANVRNYQYSLVCNSSTVGVNELAMYLKRARHFIKYTPLPFVLTDDELFLATGLNILDFYRCTNPKGKLLAEADLISSINLVFDERKISRLDFVKLALNQDRKGMIIPVFPPLEMEGLRFLAEYLESQKPTNRTSPEYTEWQEATQQLADYVEKMAPRVVNGLRSENGVELRRLLQRWCVQGSATMQLPQGEIGTVFNSSQSKE